MRFDLKVLAVSVALGASMTVATAVADAKVSVVQSSSPALARGSSFAWAPVEGVAMGIADPVLANAIVGERLERAIVGNLVARGYRQAVSPASADLLVVYRVVLKPQRQLRLNSWGGRGGCGWRGCIGLPADYSLSSERYTEGTLVLDLIERRTGRLVWRAASERRVTEKDASPEKLNKLLSMMTRSLPPA